MSKISILAIGLLMAAIGVTIFGAMNDRPLSPIGMGLFLASIGLGVWARRQTGK